MYGYQWLTEISYNFRYYGLNVETGITGSSGLNGATGVTRAPCLTAKTGILGPAGIYGLNWS